MRGRDITLRAARATTVAIAVAVSVSVAVAAAVAFLLATRGSGDAEVGRESSVRCAAIALDSTVHDAVCEVEVVFGGPPEGRPESQHLSLVGGRTQIALVDGRPARGYVSGGRDVVWPRSADLVAGETAKFHLEPLRVIELAGVRCDQGAQTGEQDGEQDGEPRVRFVPDRSVVPDGPAGRVDALQAWIDTERVEVTRRDGAVEARVPLGTAWWVLAQVPGGPCIAHVAPGRTARSSVMIGPSPRRTLHHAPTLDGASVPEGTLVAPGRLDLFAAGAVRAAVRDLGFAGAVVVGPAAWHAVDLPAADVLTLAHPSFGVAYAPWSALAMRDGAPPDASSEPGAIEFIARGGAEFSLGVAVWPAWPGTGDVFSRPPDRMLRTVATGGTSHVVRGLPPGAYRFDYTATPGARRPGTALRRGAFLVDAAVPRPRVEVTLTTE